MTTTKADDAATLKFLSELGSFQGERRHLYRHADNPLPAARFEAALKRLQATGAIEIEPVAKLDAAASQQLYQQQLANPRYADPAAVGTTTPAAAAHASDQNPASELSRAERVLSDTMASHRCSRDD